MPYGNKQMYGKDYIMKQMSKQGEMNDANESSLYREKAEFGMKIKHGVLIEDFGKKGGGKNVDSKVLGSLASKSPHS